MAIKQSSKTKEEDKEEKMKCSRCGLCCCYPIVKDDKLQFKKCLHLHGNPGQKTWCGIWNRKWGRLIDEEFLVYCNEDKDFLLCKKLHPSGQQE